MIGWCTAAYHNNVPKRTLAHSCSTLHGISHKFYFLFGTFTSFVVTFTLYVLPWYVWWLLESISWRKALTSSNDLWNTFLILIYISSISSALNSLAALRAIITSSFFTICSDRTQCPLLSTGMIILYKLLLDILPV